MARVFKPKYPKMQTLKGPDGRPLTIRKIAARGPNKGKVIMVPKREPLRDARGIPIYVESRKWAIEYVDASRRKRTIAGYTDKIATKQLAAEIERRIARQREGIFDVDFDHGGRPVTKHILDWIADLERAGRSPEYMRKVQSRVGRMQRELGWARLSSIRPDKLTDWLAAERRAGLGQRTVNHYVETAIAFCNWCVAQQRLERNPLKLVSKATVDDPRVVRRSATIAELSRLLRVAPTRAFVYIVAALTGLRRKELRLLEWGDVYLDAERPHIVLRAMTTKSKRGDTIALNGEVTDWLREAKPTDARPADRVFNSMPTSETFRRDLLRAKIPVEVDGKKLDFHALRTTHGTLLAVSGASIREAMEQMRHTDVRLTTKIYTDPRLVDMHGAVNRIPRITPRSEEREEQRATGTDGAIVPTGFPSPKSALSDIRSDIRKEVARRGRNWPQMAISRPSEKAGESGVTHSEQSSYDDSKDWRRGESNPRPATAPEMLLRA